MKRTLFVATLLFSLFNNAQAELTTLIQAEYAEKTLSHKFKDDETGTTYSEISGDTSSAVLGLTLGGQNLYANMTAEFPLRNATGYQRIPEEGNYTVSRRDYAFTAGYNVMKSLSLFAGYKYGRTTADTTSYGATITLNTYTIKETGPFIGASTSLVLGNKDTISASAAYADMKGEFINSLNPMGGAGAGQASGDGDASGYSLTVKWLHQISDATYLNLGYKYNIYDSELEHLNSFITDATSEYDYFSLGLTHFF